MSAWTPKQQRAVATRARVYEAALAEMQLVGVEAARVEDIVARAGVGWGTFYRYFPRKEDVFVEAAAQVAAVLAEAADIGDARAQAGDAILGAVWRAASAAPRSPVLWEGTFRALLDQPEAIAVVLAERHTLTPLETITRLIEHGQDAGEMRTDHSAGGMAAVLLQSVWAAAVREGPASLPANPQPPAKPPARAGVATRVGNRTLAAELVIAGMRAHRGAAGPAVSSRPAPSRIGRKG